VSVDRHVFLIGMPGAGKSSVGRLVAEKLGIPFVDLDVEIEREAGRSVREIFLKEGEPAFRELEHDAVVRVAGAPPAVVACGGGVVLREDNLQAMRAGGPIVWLNVPLATLRRRIRDIIEKRPLVKDPLDLERLYTARESVYRAAAQHEVVADADPSSIASEVVEVVT
jgi:shikimate kinase